MPRILVVILLIPVLLECVDQREFSISLVSGFPYSLGKLCLVALGFLRLRFSDIFKNKAKTAFLVIYAGVFVGSLFSNNPVKDVVSTIGVFGLLFGAFGLSEYFNDENERFLQVFFYSLFGYWAYYCFDLYFSGQVDFQYGFNSANQDIDITNHHVIGLRMTVGAMFIFASNFYSDKKTRRLLSYAVFLITLLLLIFIQSRSNTVLYLLATFLFIVKYQQSGSFVKSFWRIAVVLLLLIIPGYFLLNNLFEDVSVIEQRFDVTDVEYQQSTNETRLELYSSFFYELIKYPYGKGIGNPKIYVESASKFSLMHNQYFTYVLAGGVIAMIGIIILIRAFGRFFYDGIMKKLESPVDKGVVFGLFLFFLSLATVDSGGVLLFAMCAVIFNYFKRFYLTQSVSD